MQGLLTAAQFAAITKLMRVRVGKSRAAASLVLVDGLSQKKAAGHTGLTQSGVAHVVGRIRRGIDLAKLATD